MKSLLAVLMSSALLFQMSCASTTVINSSPSGAKLYIDGSLVGKTPYTYSDTKIVGSTTMIKLKKDGCQTFNGTMARSEKFEVGPCIGGVLVLVPFLWVMGYNPSRTFELECDQSSSVGQNEQNLISQILEEDARVQSSCRS